MLAPKQPLMLYVNDKIYLPNPAEPGAFVPASPEAAAALEAKDAEIAQLRVAAQIGREWLSVAIEDWGVDDAHSQSMQADLAQIDAALSATTKE